MIGVIYLSAKRRCELFTLGKQGQSVKDAGFSAPYRKKHVILFGHLEPLRKLWGSKHDLQETAHFIGDIDMAV
jgi:hypothetical protein